MSEHFRRRPFTATRKEWVLYRVCRVLARISREADDIQASLYANFRCRGAEKS